MFKKNKKLKKTINKSGSKMTTRKKKRDISKLNIM
jgi:hypothetical protein